MVTNPIQISVIQGDDGVWVLTYTNDDNTPFDFTGYTFSGKMKWSYNGEVVADFVCTPVDLPNGQVQYKLPHSVTSAFDLTTDRKVGIFDWQFTDTNGNIETFAYGNIVVQREV